MMSTTVDHLFTHFSHTFLSFTGLCTLWIAYTIGLADLMVSALTLWCKRDAQRHTKTNKACIQGDTEMRRTNIHSLSGCSQKLFSVSL